jgi:hypothetical protein
MPRERKKPASCLNTKSISGRLGTYWPCVLCSRLYHSNGKCDNRSSMELAVPRWRGRGGKASSQSSSYKRRKQDIRLLECWQRHDAMRVPWASIRDRITEISSPRKLLSTSHISFNALFLSPAQPLELSRAGKRKETKEKKNPSSDVEADVALLVRH